MQGAPTTNLKVGRNHKPVQPGADTEQASASTTVNSAVDEPTHDVTPPTWTGKSIGEYEIGEQIGQGGNGQVYRARHRCLDLPVAVKILRRVESDDQAAVSRFRQEAMSSARLVHPNLVRATDAGILQQHLYLVTDLVEGMDLFNLVQQQNVLSIANVCELGKATALGLEFLTQNNTVHRDIKPSNIMVDMDGHVRILDLGLARCEEHNHQLTQDGQLMGTLDFISPEQALNPRDVSFQADMYSLGCTLYFLLVGKAPFQDEHSTVAAKVMAQIQDTPKPVQHLRRDIPPAVANLVMAMLEKKPADRPASFQQVVKVLAKHAQGQNLSDVVRGKVPPEDAPLTMRSPSWFGKAMTGPVCRESHRRRLFWGFAAAFVCSWAVINSDLYQQAPPKPVERIEPTSKYVAKFEVVELPDRKKETQKRTTKPTSRSTQSKSKKSRSTTSSRTTSSSRTRTTNLKPPASQPPHPPPPPPPPRLKPDGMEAWKKYLGGRDNKAWVHDDRTGHYGYATGRESVSAAIKAAYGYAQENGNRNCRVITVNGKRATH